MDLVYHQKNSCTPVNFWENIIPWENKSRKCFLISWFCAWPKRNKTNNICASSRPKNYTTKRWQFPDPSLPWPLWNMYCPPLFAFHKHNILLSSCRLSSMEILVIIILGITGGVMIATVAVSGIYYSYRTKKAGKGKEKTAAKVTTSAPLRRSVRAESESFVVIQDESVVDFDSIPVQPETRRPIRYRFHIVWVTCGNLFSNECPIRSPCAYGLCISDIHPLHPNINIHISILLSVHLLRYWQGEFVKQSRVPLVADHFLYSHDINVRFSGDIVRNNIALRLFSDTSQMTSKCSKEKKLENEAQASGSLMFSRLHITYQPWV